MLKYNEVNLLNVHELRVTNRAHAHFTIVRIEELMTTTQIQKVQNWIYENMSGRFFVGDYYDPRTSVTELVAAFEEPAEASYFALVKDQIK